MRTGQGWALWVRWLKGLDSPGHLPQRPSGERAGAMHFEATCDKCLEDHPLEADFRVLHEEYPKHCVTNSMGHRLVLCPLHLTLYRAEREAQRCLHPPVGGY